MTLELRAASTWFLSFDNLSMDIDLRFMGSHLQVVCPLCLKKRVSGDSTALRSRGFAQSQPVFNGCCKTKPPFRHPYRGTPPPRRLCTNLPGYSGLPNAPICRGGYQVSTV